MTLAAFIKHIATHRVPPKTVSAALQGMWWAQKGDWDKAHRSVMEDSSVEAAWVHAYLHRVEGDDGNAGYWYRQAKRKPAAGPLAIEWDEIVAALTAR